MSSTRDITVEKDCGSFQKNATCTVRGRLTVVHGTPCADIRVFVTGAGGEPVATRAGLCLARDRLGELAELLQNMIETTNENQEEKAHE